MAKKKKATEPIPTPTEMEVMRTIIRKERTGRQIAMIYKKDYKRDIPYGTLYVLLRRLREEDWVSVRVVTNSTDANAVAKSNAIDSSARAAMARIDGRSRLFALTGAGERALKNAQEYYHSVADFKWPSLQAAR